MNDADNTHIGYVSTVKGSGVVVPSFIIICMHMCSKSFKMPFQRYI